MFCQHTESWNNLRNCGKWGADAVQVIAAKASLALQQRHLPSALLFVSLLANFTDLQLLVRAEALIYLKRNICGITHAVRGAIMLDLAMILPDCGFLADRLLARLCTRPPGLSCFKLIFRGCAVA